VGGVSYPFFVIPAQAGIQLFIASSSTAERVNRAPAFAGVTIGDRHAR